MIRWWGLVLLASTLGAAEPQVTEARVWSESIRGVTWTHLSGAVEVRTESSVDELARTITDWPAYPRLFPKIRSIQVGTDRGRTTLTEDTLVDVLGVAVRNRFTIVLSDQTDPDTGVRTIAWTQGNTDGRMNDLSGRWELQPQPSGGTLVLYRTRSSVVQSLPGQDGIIGLFFPGELKQIIKAVLQETRQRKEKT